VFEHAGSFQTPSSKNQAFFSQKKVKILPQSFSPQKDILQEKILVGFEDLQKKMLTVYFLVFSITGL